MIVSKMTMLIGKRKEKKKLMDTAKNKYKASFLMYHWTTMTTKKKKIFFGVYLTLLIQQKRAKLTKNLRDQSMKQLFNESINH